MREIRSMSAFRNAIDSSPRASEKAKEEFKDAVLPSIEVIAQVMKDRAEWGYEMPDWEIELSRTCKVLVNKDFILD